MRFILLFAILLCAFSNLLKAQYHAIQNGQIVATANRYSAIDVPETQQVQNISFWKHFRIQSEARRYHRLEQKAILKYHKRLQTRKVRKRMKTNLCKMNKNAYKVKHIFGPSKFGFRWR